MAKQNRSAAPVAALTPEEFQKLSPEQQLELLNSLQNKNAELSADKATLESDNKSLKKAVKEEAAKNSLPEIEVVDDEENDVEGGTYEFTCPTFIWDDGAVIDVRELYAASESKEKKEAEKATEIIAILVQRKSGILRRKED